MSKLTHVNLFLFIYLCERLSLTTFTHRQNSLFHISRLHGDFIILYYFYIIIILLFYYTIILLSYYYTIIILLYNYNYYIIICWITYIRNRV